MGCQSASRLKTGEDNDVDVFVSQGIQALGVVIAIGGRSIGAKRAWRRSNFTRRYIAGSAGCVKFKQMGAFTGAGVAAVVVVGVFTVKNLYKISRSLRHFAEGFNQQPQLDSDIPQGSVVAVCLNGEGNIIIAITTGNGRCRYITGCCGQAIHGFYRIICLNTHGKDTLRSIGKRQFKGAYQCQFLARLSRIQKIVGFAENIACFTNIAGDVYGFGYATPCGSNHPHITNGNWASGNQLLGADFYVGSR